MKAQEAPKTQIEAVRYFADESTAHDFLSGMRWADGVTCPHCGSREVGRLSVSETTLRSGKKSVRRVWNCKNPDCRKQFTVKVGTIFEDSPLPLSKWLPAVWMIVNAKNGISSCELSRSLGVTQKSAWFMLHRIRTAMSDGVVNLSGEVEADETFVGSRSRFRHYGKKTVGTGPIAMTAVTGLLERNAEKGHSRVKLCVAKNRRKSYLQGIVRDGVKAGSTIYTDALNSYVGLNETFVHHFIDHAIKYVEGRVHTNGLENFWSLLKRSLKGTYVCPAPFHLFRYLDEQATRFNERRANDATRFMNTLGRVSNRRLTFRALTGNANAQLAT